MKSWARYLSKTHTAPSALCAQWHLINSRRGFIFESFRWRHQRAAKFLQKKKQAARWILLHMWSISKTLSTKAPASVPILLDSTRSTEILSWKKFFERVESSKIQKWHSLDSLEFSLLCFERVPSTRRVFLKEHCNFYASTENVLPYCVQHKLESESGDPSKKLNPEHLEYDYERLIFFWKAEVDKKERKNN